MTAQTSATQLPLTQMPPSQCTPAQGLGGVQLVAHTVPVGQSASQAVYGRHWPLSFSQVWPSGQVTPAQGTRKQPSTHVPSTQV